MSPVGLRLPRPVGVLSNSLTSDLWPLISALTKPLQTLAWHGRYAPRYGPRPHKTTINIGLARRYGRYGQKPPPAGEGGEHAHTRRTDVRKTEVNSTKRLCAETRPSLFWLSGQPCSTTEMLTMLTMLTFVLTF
jgi:hypothetical protein